MRKIREVIVVEGQSDIQVLSKLFDADFIKTNGMGITQVEIDLIKEAQLKRGVILFLDPDSPGEKIRRKICEQVKNVKHAFIDTKRAKKNGKVGVAEADTHTLLEALENVITLNESSTGNLTMNDLIDLRLAGNLNANSRRVDVQNRFHLGSGSAKTLLKRLNMLNITYKQLSDFLR